MPPAGFSGTGLLLAGPDGASKILVRSIDYGGYAGDNLGDGNEKQIQSLISCLGGNWPYDTLLCQDGTDFQLITLDNAEKFVAGMSAMPGLTSFMPP